MAMITVDGVEMPCPSVFNWGLQDISAAESGRTDEEDWKSDVGDTDENISDKIGGKENKTTGMEAVYCAGRHYLFTACRDSGGNSGDRSFRTV